MIENTTVEVLFFLSVYRVYVFTEFNFLAVLYKATLRTKYSKEIWITFLMEPVPARGYSREKAEEEHMKHINRISYFHPVDGVKSQIIKNFILIPFRR